MNLPNFFDLATRQCIQLTLLIVIAASVTPLLARRKPHLAYILWLAVLIKSLTPPIWTSPIGIFNLGGNTSHPTATIPIFDSVAPLIAAPFSPAIIAPIHSHQAMSPAHYTTVQLAAIVWATGCSAFILIVALRWFFLHRQISRSSIQSPRELSDLLNDLRKSLGVRRQINLRLSSSPIGPAMIGILRPTLVIPAAILESKTPAQLRPLLAHEIIHLRRGDPLVALLQLISQAIWWFNPLVWFMNRQIIRTRELCCDAEVIANFDCPRQDYAQMLIDVLRLRRSVGSFVAMPGIRPIQITARRLDQIMTDAPTPRRTPLRYWLFLAIFSLIFLPGSRRSIGDPTPSAPTPVDDRNPNLPSDPPASNETTPVPQDLINLRTSIQLSLNFLLQQGYGDENPRVKELKAEIDALNRQLEMGFPKIGNQPVVPPNYTIRHFVALVVGIDHLTFQGQPTTLDNLQSLLQAVPDRPHTVLQLAYSAGDVTMRQFTEVQARAAQLVTQLGFEYLSLTGQHPADSKGSPDEMVAASAPQPPIHILPALTPAPVSQLTHIIPIQISQSGFKPGDSITISEIRGTSDHFEVDGTYQVKGTYSLASHDHATLSISVTAKDPRNGYGYTSKSQSVEIKKGAGAFTVTERMACEGFPHLSLTSDDGRFGNVYFGEGSWISW